MKSLYTQTSIISKLKKAFFEIFSNEGNHTKNHLFDLLLSVLCLNGFSSVNYNFEHFIRYISDNKLKSYYFTLNESKIDLSQWIDVVAKIGTQGEFLSGKYVNDENGSKMISAIFEFDF